MGTKHYLCFTSQLDNSPESLDDSATTPSARGSGPPTPSPKREGFGSTDAFAERRGLRGARGLRVRLRRAARPPIPPSAGPSASAERWGLRAEPEAEPAEALRVSREAPARHCNQRLWIRTCFHTSVGCILCGKPAVKNNDREYFVKIIGRRTFIKSIAYSFVFYSTMRVYLSDNPSRASRGGFLGSYSSRLPRMTHAEKISRATALQRR